MSSRRPRAQALPETEFASVPVGRYSYAGSGRAEPDGPDAVTWHMRYRVCDECGTVQRDLEATCRWHVLTPDLLEAELAAAKGRQP